MRTCSFLDSRRRERCTECGSGLDLCQCLDPDAMALDRVNGLPGRFLSDVLTAEDGIPTDEKHLFEKAVNILGDVGAQLVAHEAERSPSPDVIRRNLVQLCAALTRLATAGTDEYPYPET